ncbi:hypothetical protein [Runella sp.]|uniref:hypothetical protein n=1 Tax=Runella sp. TaxID=1960881 RepID=UPI003D12E408
MKKNTIIHGPALSGKTRKAKELVGNRKAAWVDFRFIKELTNPRFLSHVKKDDEVIVFDDVPYAMVSSLSTFLVGKITISPQAEESFVLHDIEVIITIASVVFDLSLNVSNSAGYVLIECPIIGSSNSSLSIVEPSEKSTFSFSFKINKKKIKGKIEAETHRDAWLKVLHAVDTLEKLGGLSVTDVNIPPLPHQPVFNPNELFASLN